MEWTDSQRIAAAAERMADRLEDIDHTLTAISRVGLDDDLNLTCMPLDDLVRRRLGVDATPAEAPDMSEALEAEYQRGRAEGALTERRDAVAYVEMMADTPSPRRPDAIAALREAAERLANARHVGAAVETDPENYGDGPQ